MDKIAKKMNRQIKFRAWDKEIEDYADVSMIDFKGKSAICEQHEFGISDPINLNNLVLEQFTGIKDKTGKDIYENDLIKYATEDDDDYFIAPVKYLGNDGYPAFDIPIKYIPDGYYFESNVLATGVAEEAIEAVGNIHQNYELLSEK